MQFDAHLCPFTQPTRVHKGELLNRTLIAQIFHHEDQQMFAEETSSPSLSSAANHLAFTRRIFQLKKGHRNQWLAGTRATHLSHRVASHNTIAQATRQIAFIEWHINRYILDRV